MVVVGLRWGGGRRPVKRAGSLEEAAGGTDSALPSALNEAAAASAHCGWHGNGPKDIRVNGRIP